MFRLFFKLIGLTIKLVALPFRIVGRVLVGSNKRRRSPRFLRRLFRHKKLLGVAAIVGAHLAHEEWSKQRREDEAA